MSDASKTTSVVAALSRGLWRLLKWSFYVCAGIVALVLLHDNWAKVETFIQIVGVASLAAWMGAVAVEHGVYKALRRRDAERAASRALGRNV